MDEVDDVDLVVERAAALDLGKWLWRSACAPRAAARPADAGAARLGTTTAQLLAMVGWLRLWRVQRVVMESAKQDGIPATKSAVTPDLLEDA